jgi:hypothetical protein
MPIDENIQKFYDENIQIAKIIMSISFFLFVKLTYDIYL